MKTEKVKKDIFRDLEKSLKLNWAELYAAKEGTGSLSIDFIIKKPPKKYKDRDINNTVAQFYFEGISNSLLFINYTDSKLKQCTAMGINFISLTLDQILSLKETHKRKLKLMLKKHIVCCTVEDAPKLSKSLGKLISATKKTVNTYNNTITMSEFIEPLLAKKQSKIQNNRLQLKVGNVHKDSLETILNRISTIADFFINKQADLKSIYYKTSQKKAIRIK